MNEFELDETQRLAIYQLQREVLERAIRGDGLVASMEVLCRGIEQVLEAQGGLCSILLLDGQTLRHCAAPSLPEAYCKAIDGVTIGDQTGSCGTALFRRERVVVTDIATDPLWEDYRELALTHGLGACWSNPIIASDQTPLASFAIYYPEPRSPSDFHLYLIQAFSALALIVIDHYRLALFDVLTGLPNRRHIQEELEQLLEDVDRNHARGAVIFLDIDDFKRFNESLGHDQGDALLRQVAGRLKDNTRRSERVARLGGDEFVVLLQEPVVGTDALAEAASAAAHRILSCFRAPLIAQGHTYSVSTSLGIALIDQPGLTTEDLLRKADAAMYAAKRLGGNRFAFFEESLQREANRRLELERRMAQAIESGHFVAWFQPQVRPNGAPFGAEALLRWLDPEEGVIPPDAFIPVAEGSGLIDQLQDIVLEQSCQMLVSLREKDLLPPGFRLAINISPVQFEDHRLTERLNFFLTGYGLTPERFTLEITEGLLMDQQRETHKQMQALRQRGFRFAIDDFGTGYSSLGYLHRLPVDQLKIDKSFIRELGEEATGEAIVDSVIALSKNLSFEVVAEGVETGLQSDLLGAKALNSLQGFLYARPMPGIEFMKYMNQALQVQDEASVTRSTR